MFAVFEYYIFISLYKDKSIHILLFSHSFNLYSRIALIVVRTKNAVGRGTRVFLPYVIMKTVFKNLFTQFQTGHKTFNTFTVAYLVRKMTWIT